MGVGGSAAALGKGQFQLQFQGAGPGNSRDTRRFRPKNEMMLELFNPKTLLGLFHPKILGSFLPDGFGVPYWKTLNLDRLGTIFSESRSFNMVK
jgi:hypothetical protein